MNIFLKLAVCHLTAIHVESTFGAIAAGEHNPVLGNLGAAILNWFGFSAAVKSSNTGPTLTREELRRKIAIEEALQNLNPSFPEDIETTISTVNNPAVRPSYQRGDMTPPEDSDDQVIPSVWKCFEKFIPEFDNPLYSGENLDQCFTVISRYMKNCLTDKIRPVSADLGQVIKRSGVETICNKFGDVNFSWTNWLVERSCKNVKKTKNDEENKSECVKLFRDIAGVGQGAATDDDDANMSPKTEDGDKAITPDGTDSKSSAATDDDDANMSPKTEDGDKVITPDGTDSKSTSDHGITSNNGRDGLKRPECGKTIESQEKMIESMKTEIERQKTEIERLLSVIKENKKLKQLPGQKEAGEEKSTESTVSPEVATAASPVIPTDWIVATTGLIVTSVGFVGTMATGLLYCLQRKLTGSTPQGPYYGEYWISKNP